MTADEQREKVALWRDEQILLGAKKGFWVGLGVGAVVTWILLAFVLGFVGPLIEIFLRYA